jgi:hypothetical protein
VLRLCLPWRRRRSLQAQCSPLLLLPLLLLPLLLLRLWLLLWRQAWLRLRLLKQLLCLGLLLRQLQLHLPLLLPLRRACHSAFNGRRCASPASFCLGAAFRNRHGHCSRF